MPSTQQKTKKALPIEIHYTVTDAYNKEFDTNIQYQNNDFKS